MARQLYRQWADKKNDHDKEEQQGFWAESVYGIGIHNWHLLFSIRMGAMRPDPEVQLQKELIRFR